MDLDRLARTAARAAGAPTGLVVLTDHRGRPASGGSGLDVMGRGLRRALGVPIRGRDGAELGRIAVLGRASSGWTDEDVAALDELAALIGAAACAGTSPERAGTGAASDLLAALRRELVRRGTTPALLVVYPDELDARTAALGPAAGTALADALASRMRASLRASDEVVRWHGGRVAVLAVDVPDVAAAERVCEKLRTAARGPAGAGNGAAPIPVSIGVALGGPAVPSPAALVGAAERALADARTGGGGRTVGAWALDRDVPDGDRDDDGEAEALALVERVGGGDAARIARALEAARLSGLVAARAGLDTGQVARSRVAALAADVGLGTPGSRLGWAGHDEIERRARAECARADARVLARSPALRAGVPIALHRHERWDGTGVPDGLVGAHIPAESRVVACTIAFLDVRDASSGAAAALERLRVLGAGAFDPTVLRALTGVVAAHASRTAGAEVG